jgi:hypothetical protein
MRYSARTVLFGGVSPPCPNRRTEREQKRKTFNTGRKQNEKIFTVAIALAFLLSLLFTTSPSLVNAQTQYHHVTYSIGAWGPDNFTECVHLDAWQYDDAFVALGMQAYYDTNYYQQYSIYAYNYGWWSFRAGYGACEQGKPQPLWRFYTVPVCSSSVNYGGGYTGSMWYSRGVPYSVYDNTWIIDDYDPSQSSTRYISPALSITGQSYAAFYNSNNPNQIIYMSATPTGSYYNIMTATPNHTSSEFYWTS